MARLIGGVIAGYAVWTVLWLGGNRMLFGAAADRVGAGEPYAEIGPLLGLVALSIVCSLAAGAVTAVVAAGRAHAAALALGVLLLVTGIGVQASVWALMPAWYHLTFLVLLVPVTLAGARMTASR